MAEVITITVLVILLFFIFFIRPARAEQRRRTHDLNALRVGDEVLTTGGLIATVDAVETPSGEPMILHLKLAPGIVVRARTHAIAERITDVEAFDAGEAEDDANTSHDRPR